MHIRSGWVTTSAVGRMVWTCATTSVFTHTHTLPKQRLMTMISQRAVARSVAACQCSRRHKQVYQADLSGGFPSHACSTAVSYFLLQTYQITAQVATGAIEKHLAWQKKQLPLLNPQFKITMRGYTFPNVIFFLAQFAVCQPLCTKDEFLSSKKGPGQDGVPERWISDSAKSKP